MEMKRPNPWYVKRMTAEEFLLGMISLGYPIETSLVGAFDETGRGSRRDIELPLHRDGVFSAKLAAVQGGTYIEKKNIDFVGMYCLRQGKERCWTILEDEQCTSSYELKTGEALIFDNRLLKHGRGGIVGDRLLLRVWITEFNGRE